MRITKVYTKKGDQGWSHLAGGERVPKDHSRLEAYGTIDELSSVVGLCRAFLKDSLLDERALFPIDQFLREVQHRLFDIGAILATRSKTRNRSFPSIGQKEIVNLEALIDSWQQNLPPLEEFILPAGSKSVCFLHQARTICRRAERLVVPLFRKKKMPSEILVYLNRLSDVFFVLARFVARLEGTPEVYWER